MKINGIKVNYNVEKQRLVLIYPNGRKETWVGTNAAKKYEQHKKQENKKKQ